MSIFALNSFFTQDSHLSRTFSLGSERMPLCPVRRSLLLDTANLVGYSNR